MAIGGAVFAGTSKLFLGPLGIVQIGFKGYDLGKTTADSVLAVEEDIKDINYQQDGSKPADHVRTGVVWVLSATFGEIKTGLLALLMSGISSSEPVDDGGIIDKSVFKSMLDNEAGVMKVAAVDEFGVALADLEHILNFYHVIPIIPGELINWGVDTQRNLPVEFRIKYHNWTTVELAALSRTEGGAFGYWGDPSVENVTALVWPDKEGPEIVTAICGDTNTLTVTFDENIDFFEDGAFAAAHWSAKINGSYSEPTAGVITGAGIALTFTGEFTADGTDIVFISIADEEIEDEATAPENVFPGVDSFPCTPLPSP